MFDQIHAAIRRIPKGKVATYGEVAKAAGFEGAARQVVWALQTAERLPWHRVVGAGGKILLPADKGLEQRFRLRAEGVPFRGSRVDMECCRYIFLKDDVPQAPARKTKVSRSPNPQRRR
ncbi:MAG TPA: MGMT family protein [Bryobacteraceae bacterium]|nr:MGMT family protein [Bryobacteraceae bacterium]